MPAYQHLLGFWHPAGRDNSRQTDSASLMLLLQPHELQVTSRAGTGGHSLVNMHAWHSLRCRPSFAAPWQCVCGRRLASMCMRPPTPL